MSGRHRVEAWHRRDPRDEGWEVPVSNSQWSPAARTALLVVAFLVVAAIVVALAIELFIS
jgi:hypothetical protein